MITGHEALVSCYLVPLRPAPYSRKHSSCVIPSVRQSKIHTHTKQANLQLCLFLSLQFCKETERQKFLDRMVTGIILGWLTNYDATCL